MKHFYLYFFTILCLLVFIKNTNAQWVQTKEFVSADVRTFIDNGTNLFCGTSNNGVFRSTNNGISWENVSTDFYHSVNSFTVSGDNLFAGTEWSGVFLSTNNGTDWREINSGLSNMYIFSTFYLGKGKRFSLNNKRL